MMTDHKGGVTGDTIHLINWGGLAKWSPRDKAEGNSPFFQTLLNPDIGEVA